MFRERGGGEAERDRHQCDLGEEQEAAAVEAVGERAAEQRQGDQGPELHQPEQAGEERRAGGDVDLVGEGDERGLGAEAGDERAEGEQSEVARFFEGAGVDCY